MAAGESNTARNEMKQLLAFQELFKGRFDTEEVAILLERFEWISKAAASFVLTAESADVRKLIEDERASWVKVVKPSKKKGENLADKVEGLKRPGSLLKEARLGRINTTARLFACAPCDHYWWRRTPERKEVSKCHMCQVRYDPVPRDKEWGWALFKCPSCQNEFGGFCGMWQTSPCYKCHKMVSPYCVQPPTKGHTRRTTNTHRCNNPDCQCGANLTGGPGRRVQALPRQLFVVTDGDLRNTDPGSEADYDLSQAETGADVYYEPLPETCVHPSTRRAQHLPKVIVASRPHDSSGSTVDTFLTQGDLCEKYETIIPMETIYESD